MAVTPTQYHQMNKPFPQAAQKTPSKEMGKDAFLQLFVAQLKNQDPLKPLSNKDATAQMAQFAQLEQMTNMTKMLEGIAKSLKVDRTLKAANLIGKSVLANGNSLSKADSKVSGVNLDIPKGVSNVKINIHDESGNIVRTVDLKNFTAGKNTFKWDGKGTDGKDAKDGIYSLSVVAENKDGKKFLVPTQVEGTVKAVEVKNGQQVLVLKDDRQVSLSSVWKILGQNA